MLSGTLDVALYWTSVPMDNPCDICTTASTTKNIVTLSRIYDDLITVQTLSRSLIGLSQSPTFGRLVQGMTRATPLTRQILLHSRAVVPKCYHANYVKEGEVGLRHAGSLGGIPLQGSALILCVQLGTCTLQT